MRREVLVVKAATSNAKGPLLAGSGQAKRCLSRCWRDSINEGQANDSGQPSSTVRYLSPITGAGHADLPQK